MGGVVTVASSSARRAQRLLRWYPRAWRERYGDEFCALLECELDERHASIRRTADVAWSGLMARGALVGLVGPPRDVRQQARASLAWVVAALVAFLAFGLAMWSQLVVDWQWTPPRTPDTTLATVVMTVVVATLLVLGVVALAPLVWTFGTRMVHGARRPLLVPAAILALAVTMLVVGSRAYENGWPGTGGHPWSHQGMVPGGLAAFVWSATLGVTSYWAHPGALHTFPRGELVWMAVDPVLLVTIAAAGATLLRRLELSDRVARLELRVALVAASAMGVFLLGALLWLLDDRARPHSIPTDLFHAGSIDVIGAAVMALACVGAHVAIHRGLMALRATRRASVG
jgi:hypothetical protein